MKDVSLCIIYKKISRLNVLCFDNTINSFIKRLLSQKVILYKKNTHFIIIDSNYNILSLSSKVPNKLYLIMIDLKEFCNQEKKYKLTNSIKLIENYIFTFETFIKENINIQEIPKKEIKIDKEVFNEVIEPLIVIEKKEILNTIINNEEVNNKEKKQKNQIKETIKKKLDIIKNTVKKKKLVKAKKQIESKKIIIEQKPIIKKEEIKPEIVINTILKTKKEENTKAVKSKSIKQTNINNNDKIHVIVSIKKDKKSIIAVIQKNKKEEKEENYNSQLIDNKEKFIDKDIYNALDNTIIIKNIEQKINQQQPNKKDKKSIINKQNNVINSNNKIIKKKEEGNEFLNNNQEELDIKQIKVEQTKTNQKEEIIEGQKIIYTVLSPDEEVLYHQEITIKNPVTIEQLLEQSGLMINNKDGFIESINGIKNEGMSGWVFEVNNVPVMVSASEYIVNPNEQITWKYVDFSKMMDEEQTIDKDSAQKMEQPPKKLVKNRKENININ